MHALYILSVWLHVLAAITWVGGMIFLVIVLVPTIKQPDFREQAMLIVQVSGQKFKTVGWACLITLVLTGTTNIFLRGLGPSLATREFWGTSLGILLSIKLTLVASIITLSAIHDFVIGPKAVAAWKVDPLGTNTIRLRAAASWMGRANFLLSLLVVTLAIMLFRGTPW